MGGIGKTSVAQAVARALADRGRRVAFVELDQETEAGPALERVCRSIGVDPGAGPGGPARRGAAPGSWTRSCWTTSSRSRASPRRWSRYAGRTVPALLVTCRAALRVPGEQLVTVPPLSLTSASGAPSPAVELFLSSAERAGGGGLEELDGAQRLCTLLDGIPLAIQLAASRSRVLTPTQLAQRVERSPDDLAQPARGQRRRPPGEPRA